VSNLTLFKQAVKTCHRRYTYTADKVQFGKSEHWRDHVDEVLEGKAWTDDCDGWALTCGSYLNVLGVKPEDIYLCVVDAHGGLTINHAVVAVPDEEGNMYVADCNYQRPWKQGVHRYTFLKFRTMNDKQFYYFDGIAASDVSRPD